jgi:hypothetical protein
MQVSFVNEAPILTAILMSVLTTFETLKARTASFSIEFITWLSICVAVWVIFSP